MANQTFAESSFSSSLSPYRNKLLNFSIVSAEAHEKITVKRKSSEELLEIRPTLHLFPITPFGETKTTLADRISKHCATREHHPYFKVSGVTAPAIAGSIDEKFRVVPPLCAQFLNGTMIVDEFNTNPVDKSNAIGAALDVLESEESSRAMGRKPTKPCKNSGSGIQYEVTNGRIHFKGLRCNWIFLSAKYLQMNRSLPMAMLVSRTVPIWFDPSWEDLNAIDNDPDLLFKPLNLIAPKMETIDNPTYLEIREYVQKTLKLNQIPKSYYFRTVNDCVRAYVFNGYEHDWGFYDYILKNKTMFVSNVEKAGASLAELEMLTENAIESTKETSA